TSCGKTKCEAICCNVIAPHSVETVLKELHVSFFSISSDASNKGNRKLFPLCIRYFTNSGIKDRVLDFYEDSEETSDAISAKIKLILKNCNLEISSLSTYAADNASVNYGKHHSAFQNLKQEVPYLIPTICHRHIIHNTAKFAAKALGKMNVETLTMKVYNEFSCSAKNVAELRECFEFVNLDWQNVLRHVPTRWLSLYPAVCRLVEKWPAVKSYFLSQGEYNCDQYIWKFVAGNCEDEVSDTPTIAELYLYFAHHVLGIFHSKILILENSKCSSPQLYSVMHDLLNKLNQRLQDEFYDYYKVILSLKELSAGERTKLKSQLISF
uniref:DUF4371 domain-containing protein n=1 Tax=Latimeria chalumnae TaxID=7897 RepID=H3ACH3_LATCH